MKALVILWIPDPAPQQPVKMEKVGHISQLARLFHSYMGLQLDTKTLFRYSLPTRYSILVTLAFGKYKK
jgi:hypothetical protein